MAQTDKLVNSGASCKCAASFNLILLLTEVAMDWARDDRMRKYVLEHIQRIDSGVDYLEKDCGCKMPEGARSDIGVAIDELHKGDWKVVRAKLDDLYIAIDRTVIHCAGYKTPHF